MKYGAVQKAYIGISYPPDDASEEQKKPRELKTAQVYLGGVADDGAAKEGGLQKAILLLK